MNWTDKAPPHAGWWNAKIPFKTHVSLRLRLTGVGGTASIGACLLLATSVQKTLLSVRIRRAAFIDLTAAFTGTTIGPRMQELRGLHHEQAHATISR